MSRLSLKFGNKSIVNGQTILLREAQQPIHLQASMANNIYYTFIMTDTDAPAGVWLHDFKVNVARRNRFSTGGTTIATYQPPNPPTGTGIHHYYIRWYAQSGLISTAQIASLKQNAQQRAGFNEQVMVQQLGLQLLQTLMFITSRQI